MPHLYATKQKINFVQDNEFSFLVNGINESLIAVKFENLEFLLSLREKRGELLLKYDKLTRVSNLALLKKSILSFANRYNLDIITQNLKNKSNEKSHEYQKSIDYFINMKFDRAVYFEIGFGSGRHLIKQALENQDKIIIGLEIYKPSIEQVLRAIKLQDIKNIIIVDYDARLFLELLPANSVEKIFVHFPVPWDKKPHRRVYSNTFINEAKKVLKIGGKLELRTDSKRYYEYVKELYSLNNLTNSVEISKNIPAVVSSKYEDRWTKQKKDIYDIILTNLDINKPKKFDYDFSFNDITISKTSIASLPTKAVVDSGILVHFESYYSSDTIQLIKIAFGDFNRVEHKYIIIDDNQCRYFQSLPIPTKSNYIAHQIIKERISG